MKIEKIISGERISEINKSVVSESVIDSNIVCPFCLTGDFDLIGLKSHLEHGDCDVYNRTDIGGCRRYF